MFVCWLIKIGPWGLIKQHCWAMQHAWDCQKQSGWGMTALMRLSWNFKLFVVQTLIGGGQGIVYMWVRKCCQNVLCNWNIYSKFGLESFQEFQEQSFKLWCCPGNFHSQPNELKRLPASVSRFLLPHTKAFFFYSLFQQSRHAGRRWRSVRLLWPFISSPRLSFSLFVSLWLRSPLHSSANLHHLLRLFIPIFIIFMFIAGARNGSVSSAGCVESGCSWTD